MTKLIYDQIQCFHEECEEFAVWAFHIYFFSGYPEGGIPAKFGHGSTWPHLCPKHAEEYYNWVKENGGMTTTNNWMCARKEEDAQTKTQIW